MARREKKKRGRAVATGGILGILLLFLFNGGLNLDVGNSNGQNEGEEAQTEVTQDYEADQDLMEDVIIEVIDNMIYINEEAVALDQVLSTLGSVPQVILRAEDAKQVTYDEVKTLLNEADIVIVEE